MVIHTFWANFETNQGNFKTGVEVTIEAEDDADESEIDWLLEGKVGEAAEEWAQNDNYESGTKTILVSYVVENYNGKRVFFSQFYTDVTR